MAILDSAVAWWHADRYSGSGAWQDESGNGHHAQLGSTSGADTNDPEFLEYAGDQYIAVRDVGDKQNLNIDDQTAQYGSTDDLELIVDFAHHDITDFGVVAGKKTGTEVWYFGLHNSICRLKWRSSTDTNNTAEATVNPFTALYSEGERFQMKVTLDVDNGAGAYEVKFYHRSTDADSWVQLGATITGGATTDIEDSTQDVTLFSSFVSNVLNGDIYRVQQKVGIGGTTVLDINCMVDPSPGDASFTASVGGTVNIYRGTALEPVVVNRNLWLLTGDDFFEVAYHADLDFEDNEDFSVAAAYRKRNDVDARGGLVTNKTSVSASNTAGYSIFCNHTDERGYFLISDGSAADLDADTSVLPAGDVSTIGRIDYTAQELEVFQSGTGSGTPDTAISTAGPDVSNDVRMGANAHPTTPSEFHEGSFIGAAIFATALSDADIATLHTELLADQTVAGGGTLTASADAALQKLGLTRTAVLDAAMSVTGTETATLGAALAGIGLTRTTLIDAAIAFTDTATLDLDAVIAEAGLARSLFVDAVLRAVVTRTASIDAVLVAAGTVLRQAALDAALQVAGLTRQTALDSVLRLTQLAVTNADAVLSSVLAVTAGLDAYIYAGTGILTTDLDAALLQQAAASLGVDAYILSSVVAVPPRQRVLVLPDRRMRRVARQ